jgi:hypothetical protein
MNTARQLEAQAALRARHSSFVTRHSSLLFSGGSAETSRSCGHTASSGAAGANVAPETANPSARGAGGVS